VTTLNAAGGLERNVSPRPSCLRRRARVKTRARSLPSPKGRVFPSPSAAMPCNRALLEVCEGVERGRNLAVRPLPLPSRWFRRRARGGGGVAPWESQRSTRRGVGEPRRMLAFETREALPLADRARSRDTDQGESRPRTRAGGAGEQCCPHGARRGDHFPAQVETDHFVRLFFRRVAERDHGGGGYGHRRARSHGGRGGDGDRWPRSRRAWRRSCCSARNGLTIGGSRPSSTTCA
jgi:hypothetical protein